ncbi:hypothetical protein CcrColossus_gp105 [Caulobacter phage CcrColossus]|uniref:Uncharacterized protein n=1 Tax=Caulobacter phage CcrColossus TaxID=1211640 RepID=K4JUG3_9CAUD|nr:hypothetical protein CcrColossus_gp105 [Caulobacter phage CcrColossus]AFU87975.1 hypothetical protein CcrColossus_gp105 [Caulobacter phage CcrColossus]
MSHFALVVVTTTNSKDQLKEVLQPFHEFECTGISDQYVVEVDDTDEKRASYETAKRRRYRSPDGALHDPYDNIYFRDLTADELKQAGTEKFARIPGLFIHDQDWNDGRGYRSKVHFVPTGWEDVEVPVKEFSSLRDYIADETDRKVIVQGGLPDYDDQHKHGYTIVDAKGEVVKTVRRTNPNAKWDWWEIGGRYRGRLLSKGVFGYQGRPGTFNNDTYHQGGSDGLLKGEIDFERMRRLNVEKHLGLVEEAYAKMGDVSREEVKALCIEYADLFNKVMRPKFAAIDAGTWKDGNVWEKANAESPRFEELGKLLDPFYDYFNGAGFDRDIGDPWAWAEAIPPLTAYAYLGTDGVWRASGEMGWFGISSKEKDSGEWNREFAKALAAVPDHHMIWVVDCHI